MKKFLTKLLGVALVLGASGGALAAEELVVNGGFEANVGNFVSVQAPNSWNVAGHVYAVNAASIQLDSAHSGVGVAGMSSWEVLSSLSQTLVTTPGQNYSLSFWLANSFYALDPDGGAGTNQFVVYWGGESVFDAAVALGQTDVPKMGWTHFSVDLSSYSEATTLRFETFNRYGQFGLDDVSVLTVTAVPEPSAWLLMLAGMGVLATSVRRQRRH